MFNLKEDYNPTSSNVLIPDLAVWNYRQVKIFLCVAVLVCAIGSEQYP